MPMSSIGSTAVRRPRSVRTGSRRSERSPSRAKLQTSFAVWANFIGLDVEVSADIAMNPGITNGIHAGVLARFNGDPVVPASHSYYAGVLRNMPDPNTGVARTFAEIWLQTPGQGPVVLRSVALSAGILTGGNLKLIVRTDPSLGNTLDLFFDGAPVANASNRALAGAGRAGIFSNISAGVFFDNFLADRV